MAVRVKLPHRRLGPIFIIRSSTPDDACQLPCPGIQNDRYRLADWILLLIRETENMTTVGCTRPEHFSRVVGTARDSSHLREICLRPQDPLFGLFAPPRR